MLPLLRYTLDLFEQIQPLVTEDRQPLASGLQKRPGTVPVSPEPKGRTIAPDPGIDFRHPQASRECRLGSTRVAYALTRSARRSIGLSVGADGLAVRAPKWMGLQAIDAAVQAKANWILRKLQEGVERQSRLPQAIAWQDGATLPYLGQTLQLQLDPAHHLGAPGPFGACSTNKVSGVAPELTPIVLPVSLPHSATPAQIRDAAQAWLMRQARSNFEARLDHFAPLLGVRWKKLTLSQANTRWGSARSDGSIRLNWRLMHFSQAIIDYVVVHELSHLREMNHSAQFWHTVATVLPDYSARRQQLKANPVVPWR
jgi:predicted metal-dependent hydrolase